MTPIVNNPSGSAEVDKSMLYEDLGYAYPENLDLRPSSDTHQNVIEWLNRRLYIADAKMSERFDSWMEVDRTLQLYADIETKKNLRKIGVSDQRVEVIYPYSFAVLDTLLSYLTGSLLQPPIFRYAPTGPEDVAGAAMMELVVDHFVRKNKLLLPLHTAIRDDLVYGFGAVSPIWNYGKDNYGCGIENINPYYILPDPNVPIHKIQEGEFVGWVKLSNRYNCLSRERDSEGAYFNARYLKATTATASKYLLTRQSKEIINYETNHLSPVCLVTVYAKIIPAELGIGYSEYPEIWMFEIANDTIILSARPANMGHDRFPIAVGADNIDGYSYAPPSRIEALQGLQTIVDWLISSHITNVRCNIANRFIVDPKMVDVKAFNTGAPVIKLTTHAQGRSPRDVVHQIQTHDVTQAHLAATEIFIQAMQRISGVDSATAGELRRSGPERLTGREADTTHQGAMNRFNHINTMLSVMLIQEVAEQCAYNTKQLLNKDLWVEIPGRYRSLFKSDEAGGTRVPTDALNVDTDVKIDYEGRNGRYQTSDIRELLSVVMANPILSQQYDLPKIVDRIFRREGLVDIEDLKINVMPDEQVQREIERGNIAPIDA